MARASISHFIWLVLPCGLSILDEVHEEGIVITKRGRPVAKLTPIRAESGTLLGALKGKVTIKGDILSTGVAWHAECLTGTFCSSPSRTI